MKTPREAKNRIESGMELSSVGVFALALLALLAVAVVTGILWFILK